MLRGGFFIAGYKSLFKRSVFKLGTKVMIQQSQALKSVKTFRVDALQVRPDIST